MKDRDVIRGDFRLWTEFGRWTRHQIAEAERLERLLVEAQTMKDREPDGGEP